MKKLENYGVIEINKIESSKINGGDGWLYDLGASAHGLWCGIRDGLASYAEHAPGYVGTQYGV